MRTKEEESLENIFTDSYYTVANQLLFLRILGINSLGLSNISISSMP